MAGCAFPSFHFLGLPLEIRDQIYGLLLRDEALNLPVPPRNETMHGLKAMEMAIHMCMHPKLMRVNSQMRREYSLVAYESMQLTVRYTLCSNHGPYMLPLLSSYDVLAPHVQNKLRSISVQLSYGLYGPELPQVRGINQFILDLPALKRLKIDVFLMVELVEAHYSPDAQVPQARELIADLPDASDSNSAKKITTSLNIVSRMFEQNSGYSWEPREAKTVGEMWLHSDNLSVFRAVSSGQGPYTWHGLNLDYWGPNVSWEQLWEECTTNPLQTNSPYIT